LLLACAGLVPGCGSDRGSLDISGATFMVVLHTDGTTFPCPATPGETCIGFVGKGDVQSAFQLNNLVIQDEIESFAPNYGDAFVFSLDATDTYAFVCEWFTGPQNQTRHEVTHQRHTGITAAIDGEPRSGPTQFTGFNLLAFEELEESGTIPVVGGDCPGTPGTDAVIISVQLLSDGGDGGLFVTRTSTGDVAQLDWP
jgi:hypothetical protein